MQIITFKVTVTVADYASVEEVRLELEDASNVVMEDHGVKHEEAEVTVLEVA